MLTRILGSFGVAALALTGVAWGQSSTKPAKEPVADGRPLSAWVADLKAPSPETRNAAAYEIAGLGPSAAAAVPALIDALNDPEPSVRLPVAVALREIGPAAKAAVPALTKVYQEDLNDEVASMARRAISKIAPESLPAE